MTGAETERKPDDWVRLTFFAGLSIVLTIVVLFVLRKIFPGLRYPMTIVAPYGASVVACAVLGLVLRAWRKSAARAANLVACLICFLAPAVPLYAMVAAACRSIMLQCI